jgi:hypothetical protein
MNVLREITLAAILFAVVGNSSATTNLSPVFSIPASGQMELIIFVTPHITTDPTIPAICRSVKITPVIADMDGTTPTGAGVVVAVLDTGIDYLDPFVLTPGKLAKITIPNTETYRKNVAVEFMVDPPDAQPICGPKASGVVINSAGEPIGGPTKLNEQFKAIAPSSNVLR